MTKKLRIDFLLIGKSSESHFREHRLCGKDARWKTGGKNVNVRLRANFMDRVLAVLRFFNNKYNLRSCVSIFLKSETSQNRVFGQIHYKIRIPHAEICIMFNFRHELLLF